MDRGWSTVMDRLDFLPFPTTTAAVASLFSDDAGRAATEDGSVRRWLRRQCGQWQTSASSNPDCFGTLLYARIWPTEIEDHHCAANPEIKMISSPISILIARETLGSYTSC
ncbi:hypothetical protein MRB53_021608 [Persea americana]|uniref:Uncharacterized protein n=1 Tax=Persea americana TaxID=3435 RepID=A0ACC2L467_PERAE|nr:hypothetical protein MRB53_021608 [Persea americana]